MTTSSASGDATRNELKRLAPGPVYRIGLGEDMSLYAGIDLCASPMIPPSRR